MEAFQGLIDQSSQLYCLQPINTGFSYSDDERDRVYDEKVVAADMLDFLTVFMDGENCSYSREH